MTDTELVRAVKRRTGLRDAGLGRLFGVSGEAVRRWRDRDSVASAARPMLEVLAEYDAPSWGQGVWDRVEAAR